ncbi:MAG: veratrol--corrinoid protein metyltransferase [Lachnospiraceae bacterium]|nr:veratrol--corrinoid protein metyltransferase [Lachnospiraceae bacterium]
MAQLTERENYLMAVRGEQPEWIPVIRMDRSGKGPTCMASPSFLMGQMRPGGDNKDIWGVEYVTSAEAGGAMIPKTWDFLLDDITKWHDVIKAPSLEGIDWEQMAKKDLEMFKVDRENKVVVYMTGGTGIFQALMAFMGFTEGLCALSEEPEECEALFDYFTDFYCTIMENCIDYYKPDAIQLTDDTAAWGNPFVSLPMFQRYFVPRYSRFTQFAKDRGLFVTYHNCGKCESFMPDMIEKVGITVWDPAQDCNDLLALKNKYGNRLIMSGCINGSSTFVADDLTEDRIRDILWDVANKYAPGGGFFFQASFIIPDETNKYDIWRRDTVFNVMDEISKEFYKKN